MPPDTPLNKAHQHSSNADDYINQGFLIPAAEEHYKSAEAFLQCVDQASDEGTKRTLRMLYNDHNKAGKDLQRRIAKLREEGKDPSLAQRPPAPPRSHTSSSPGPHPSSSHVMSRGRMVDSNHTIDDSYMVLGQQSDPMDTFNQFWTDLEGMLDNLSQPVAFATAPLTRFGGPESSRDGPSNMPKPSGNLRVSVEPTFRVNPHSDASDVEEVMADEDSPSGESFFMIPSATNPTLATNLQKENESLRVELASLQRRLDVAERMRVEQEEQLRERIGHARREAQRVKNSGLLPPRPAAPSIDLNSLHINLPSLTPMSHPAGNRDQHLIRRIKELEEEVRSVRVENEKQKAMIVKFRERWERLKETAKRKRNAKASTGADITVREMRIDEEPEAEVAAEEGDARDSG
ncbi:hypothetical protein JB92DRAFT_3130597 [Gautieria morchelliformis]|nr:hypothetical protein JB92DRAFT_3130597 [Gautieria morchelliformis]